jgi:HAD superfamily hydrolase (TIGR01490 family)
VARPIAFFDVDHTITSGSTGRRFAEAAARRGLLKLRDLAVIPINYLLYRLGSGGASLFEGEFPAIRGLAKDELEDLAREVFELRTRHALRPSLVGRIQSIKAEGGRIVLATSSLDFIVAPLAERIGADEVLASSLEYSGGRCTGRLAKALFGPAKRDGARTCAAASGVELSECSFFSDSIHDLPLLSEVGEPVAVDPDGRLRRVARSRGWEIMETKRLGRVLYSP